MSYFEDGWNYVDIMHIVCGYLNIAMQLYCGTWNIFSKIMMVVVVMCAMIKSFFFLRINEEYSMIVKRLISVISKLSNFVIFFAVLILQFAMAFSVIGPNESPEYKSVGYSIGAYLYSLRFSVGDFDFSPVIKSGHYLQDAAFWFVFFILSILSLLIILNFIIA